MTREEMIRNLTQPLTAEEIEWVITGVSRGKDGEWTVIAPYTDARAIMRRLDAYVGPFNWRVTYREMNIGGIQGVVATLEIRDPESGEWIAKEDGAPAAGARFRRGDDEGGEDNSKPETAFKGGLSGALKRAAAAWGIGRELYFYPTVRIYGRHKFVPWKVLNRLKGLPKAFAEGKPLPEMIPLNEDGTDYKKNVA